MTWWRRGDRLSYQGKKKPEQGSLLGLLCGTVQNYAGLATIIVSLPFLRELRMK